MLHNSPFYNKYSKIIFYIELQLIMGYDIKFHTYSMVIFTQKYVFYSVFLVLVVASPLKSTIITLVVVSKNFPSTPRTSSRVLVYPMSGYYVTTSFYAD